MIKVKFLDIYVSTQKAKGTPKTRMKYASRFESNRWLLDEKIEFMGKNKRNRENVGVKKNSMIDKETRRKEIKLV